MRLATCTLVLALTWAAHAHTDDEGDDTNIVEDNQERK